MSRRADPRETVVAALAGIFLLGFVLLFAWLILITWTARGRLPQFVETEMFTHVTTSIVGLVGGIAATWMGRSSSSRNGLQTTFGWIYVVAYFILGLAALGTLLVNSAQGNQSLVPEAVKNLGTVSFGLALAAVGSYLGSST